MKNTGVGSSLVFGCMYVNVSHEHLVLIEMLGSLAKAGSSLSNPTIASLFSASKCALGLSREEQNRHFVHAGGW